MLNAPSLSLPQSSIECLVQAMRLQVRKCNHRLSGPYVWVLSAARTAGICSLTPLKYHPAAETLNRFTRGLSPGETI